MSLIGTAIQQPLYSKFCTGQDPLILAPRKPRLANPDSQQSSPPQSAKQQPPMLPLILGITGLLGTVLVGVYGHRKGWFGKSTQQAIQKKEQAVAEQAEQQLVSEALVVADSPANQNTPFPAVDDPSVITITPNTTPNTPSSSSASVKNSAPAPAPSSKKMGLASLVEKLKQTKKRVVIFTVAGIGSFATGTHFIVSLISNVPTVKPFICQIREGTTDSILEHNNQIVGWFFNKAGKLAVNKTNKPPILENNPASIKCKAWETHLNLQQKGNPFLSVKLPQKPFVYHVSGEKWKVSYPNKPTVNPNPNPRANLLELDLTNVDWAKTPPIGK